MSMKPDYLLNNLKLSIRNRIGRNHLWATSRKDLTLTKDADLCVEGFPRSANTYSVLLIEKFANRSLKIGHHLHIPSQLKYAVSWDIPAILLLRNPVDAIPSLVLREQGISIWNAINWYNTFHSELIPIKDDLIVWDFNRLIKQPLECLRELDEQLGWWDIGSRISEQENEEIFQEIDRLDQETKSGQDMGLVNSRPNQKKGAAKKEVLEAIRSNAQHQKNMERASELYQLFSS